MPSLRIVMFVHPAEEFNPRLPRNTPAQSHSSWNVSKHHCRRLLLKDGEYVDAQGVLKSGAIAFWGEWEADTLVTKLPPRVNSTDARWVHEPLYPNPCPAASGVAEKCDNGCCMNTDPCVFGMNFKYALCRQKREYKGRVVNTQMQDLAPGSLIVFCGRISAQFYLDTVFVVEKGVKYFGPDKRMPRKVLCDPAYRILTLDQTVGDLTFYRGTAFTNHADAIYSFVPGSVVAGAVANPSLLSQQSRMRCPLDFARLNKAMGKSFFNKDFWRGFKSEIANPTEIRLVWHELLSQTRRYHVPAVHFTYP